MGAKDPDNSVRAWRYPDSENAGVFVLINIQYDRKSRPGLGCASTRWLRKEVWDQTKRDLPSNPAQRVASLAKHEPHRLYGDEAQGGRLRSGSGTTGLASVVWGEGETS